MTKQYAERDPSELDEIGGYYFRHVIAMTKEDLHSKSQIACELGWRDMKIDELQQKLDQVNEKLSRYSMSAGQADQFAAEAKLIRKALGFSEDAQDVAPIDLLEKINAMSAENASLKSNLMFWDAEDPEAPYESPLSIACECEMQAGETFEVQVAARLPNMTYRVVSADEVRTEVEWVSGSITETPATDAYLNSVRADAISSFWEHSLCDVGMVLNDIRAFDDSSEAGEIVHSEIKERVDDCVDYFRSGKEFNGDKED